MLILITCYFHSYLDRLSSQLLRQQELSQKASSLVTEHTYKIKETGQQQLELEKALDIQVTETKRIKSMVRKTNS